MKVIDLRQRTPEWKAWRIEGISATSCGVVMGENPDKTPLELWSELVGITEPADLNGIAQVKRGQKFEPLALHAFEEKFGKIGLPICAEHEEYPFIRASFDGVLNDGEPVEIKNLADINHRDVLLRRTESAAYLLYRWQVMHQLIVTGASRGYLWFWSPRHEPVCLVVDRDEKLIARIIDQETKFWDLVETGQAPEPIPARDLMPVRDQKHDKEWKFLAEARRDVEKALVEAKAKLSELNNTASSLDEKLKALMGEYNRADLYGVKITKFTVDGGTDWMGVAKDLLEDIPEPILAKHQKEPSARTRISVQADYTPPEQPKMPRIRKAVIAPSQQQASPPPAGDFWF